LDKDYAARKWVIVDQVLTTRPCELIYAIAITNDSDPRDNKIYDGENTNGELIVNLQTKLNSNVVFNPPEPVKCHRGLYIDFGDNTEGVFVMWRNLPRK